MIRGVPDRHPSHSEIVPRWRQPGAVHDGRRDLRPFRVGQQPVIRRGPYGAVPHRLAVIRSVERGQGLSEQPGQPTEVPRSIGAASGFQLGGITEPGDEMWIGVLVRLSRAVQVIQQPPGIGAAEHFPNHPERSGWVTECSVAPAPPPHPNGEITHAQNSPDGSRSSPRCPVAFNRATA